MSEDTAGALGGSRLDEAEIAERKRLHQTAWKNLLLEQKLERMREFMKELDRSAQYQRTNRLTSDRTEERAESLMVAANRADAWESVASAMMGSQFYDRPLAVSNTTGRQGAGGSVASGDGVGSQPIRQGVG